MRSSRWALALFIAAGMVGPSLALGDACVGAVHAAMLAQERSTPEGEWCQRRTTRMPAKAHACECHKHDCTADPADPNSYSAHTDNQCLNFCTTANCQCSVMDCK